MDTRPFASPLSLETSNLSQLILEAKWATRKSGRIGPVAVFDRGNKRGGELEQFCRIKVAIFHVFSACFLFFLFFFFRGTARVIDKSTARSAISIGYLKATIR